jgi:hypothetical protein
LKDSSDIGKLFGQFRIDVQEGAMPLLVADCEGQDHIPLLELIPKLTLHHAPALRTLLTTWRLGPASGHFACRR